MRIYPIYSAHLRAGLEALTGNKVGVVTTDCFCFEPDRAVNGDYEFIDFRYIGRQLSKNRAKNSVKLWMYPFLEHRRGRLFASRAGDFDVVDFQQSSYAFGYESLSSFLGAETKTKKIVTIHKFDAIQKERPELNLVYNQADGVIVSSKYMKQGLIDDGVDADRIAVVYHGTSLPAATNVPKTQAILFCGSPIPRIKGFEQVVVALRMLRGEGIDLRVKIYGFFSGNEKDYAIGLARAEGVDGLLEWQNFANEGELTEEYQKSLVCLIPYTGYAGYFPAAHALGNGVPVIATDILGHSEYVDGAGVLIPPGSPEELVSAVKTMLSDDALRQELGAKGRKRAEEVLSWETMAAGTLEVFRAAVEGRAVATAV
jgi:glycosyltransferase involved in cell wall biosynthesis